MIKNLVQLAPVCITFVAGFFLSKSALELKVENITWNTQNTFAIMENLSNQKADTLIGTILLFVALIWQMANLTQATLIGDFAAIPGTSVLVAILLTALLFVVCYFGSKYIGRSIYSRALGRLKKD